MEQGNELNIDHLTGFNIQQHFRNAVIVNIEESHNRWVADSTVHSPINRSITSFMCYKSTRLYPLNTPTSSD